VNLLESTNTLLQSVVAGGTSLRKIALESEGRIEYDWLKRFAAGDIDDPSVNRIQALHDRLIEMRSKGSNSARKLA